MAAEVASPSASLVRTWRMAFLTLRDELHSRPSTSSISAVALPIKIIPLLHDLIISQSQSLIAAVPHLPPREAISDSIYLVNLAASITPMNKDATDVLILTCQLVHDLILCVPLNLISSDWVEMLDSLGKLVDVFLRIEDSQKILMGNAAFVKAVMSCLDIARRLSDSQHQGCTLSDNIHLVKFLHHVILCSHPVLHGFSHFGSDQRYYDDFGISIPRLDGLWLIEAIAFDMVGETFSIVGSTLPIDIWRSTLEVLRKVMDTLSSRMLLLEDGVRSRFFTSLLNCLHLVLVNRKGSLSDHVVSLVSILRMFLTYGLNNISMFSSEKDKNHPSTLRPGVGECKKAESGVYRPPHLRREIRGIQHLEPETSRILSEYDTSLVEFSSSDSDYSDNDGTLKDSNRLRGCKARVAAINCIQDLCEADPKAFIAQWTVLLPTSEVLYPRKCESTLTACLLFDPHMKARIASASAIATMLDGPSSVALQVAEYKETIRCGSYTSLSSSLGQILMQLHTDVLYLIRREMHAGLLASLFKILLLLISSTPYLDLETLELGTLLKIHPATVSEYSRMLDDLLPSVISSVHARIRDGFPFKSNQTCLLAAAISCLTVAFSVSPSSLRVNEIFQAEMLSGSIMGAGQGGVLVMLFQHVEQITNQQLCFEALQALKALFHNYPSVTIACWKKVSTIVLRYLNSDTTEVLQVKRQARNVGSSGEKVVSAAVKVLDECLRAISGFRGTGDALSDKLMETPFASDCVRDKKISSAPSYGIESLDFWRNMPNEYSGGKKEWSEALQKHIPLSLCHASAMVRAACTTCFAGITSIIFFSLEEEKQDFILSSCINVALTDEVPSVRSAACRAIGVIACFPDIFKSAEILFNFINAVKINTQDRSISVRIPASWALANICDSLRYCINELPIDVRDDSHIILLLSNCVLRLTEDGDKIKSNAVRALGNLSKVIHFSSVNVAGHSTGSSLIVDDNSAVPSGSGSSSLDSTKDVNLLERIVQAFLSCLATGNVKVQWNVCHALSNFFLNETIRMQQMDWALSLYNILLLLLRDSTNFKIRIQAAAALAVPVTVSDYGGSFPDVVRGLVHILENAGLDQTMQPSNFKYKAALEKQLTSTMLHLLDLCSSSNHEPLKEFLHKKSSFFEKWFDMLCSSLEESSVGDGSELCSNRNKKVEMIFKALQSLIDIYKCKNQCASMHRLEKILNYLMP